MADRAIGRKSRRLVIRIVRVVVIRHMARGAGCTGQVVIAIHVTLQARNRRVRAR